MSNQTEEKPILWQSVASYAITWGGWIGLIFALAQCQGIAVKIDDNLYAICGPQVTLKGKQ
jgi:hypothetical protein